MRGAGAEKKVILLGDPYNQPEESWMEFRLTYRGPLLAIQRDPVAPQADKRADHKHDIRKRFHPQLKRLWEITPFLRAGERSAGALLDQASHLPIYDQVTLAKKHAHFGFNFVPLVTEDLELICGLEILFLRPDTPGKVIQSGDIDNRLKTLFDALRIPSANEDYGNRTPAPDEIPFFCLLEDDRLITKISVETDQLLDLTTSDPHEVSLVVTVRLRPYELHLGNMPFG